MRPGRVLCLGARTGSEVEGARAVGFAASIGVDLHPLSDSVMRADWHKLPFGDDSFENVFTNSLDHCFNFLKLALEISRVLMPNGIFIFETHTGYALSVRDDMSLKKSIDFHAFNSMFWDDVEDLIDELRAVGLVVVNKSIGKKTSVFALEKKRKWVKC